jgi:hypothetical protein
MSDPSDDETADLEIADDAVIIDTVEEAAETSDTDAVKNSETGEAEDAEHFLRTCPRWQEIRQQTIGCQNITCLLNSPTEVVEFLRKTVRLGAPTFRE